MPDDLAHLSKGQNISTVKIGANISRQLLFPWRHADVWHFNVSLLMFFGVPCQPLPLVVKYPRKGVIFMPENGIYRSPMDKPDLPKPQDQTKALDLIDRQMRKDRQREIDAKKAAISTAEQIAQIKQQMDQQAVDNAKLAEENRRLQWIVIFLSVISVLVATIGVLVQVLS